MSRPNNTNRNSKPILEREYKILKSYINGLETFRTTKVKWLRSIEILFLSGLRVSEILDISIEDIQNSINNSELSVFVKKQKIVKKLQYLEKHIANIVIKIKYGGQE